MPLLTLKIGDKPLDITHSGDLGKLIHTELDLAFRVVSDAWDLPTLKLSDFGKDPVQLDLHLDKPGKWSLGNGITIAVKPNVTGFVRIMNTGKVVDAKLGDGDVEQDISVTVPAGSAYVSVSLTCSLEVDTGGSYSAGEFGVSANLGEEREFVIANHRIFPNTTSACDAIGAVFSEFVLPFKTAGFAELHHNDCVEFTFEGKLSLGFGCTYGLSRVFLGGKALSEISKTITTPAGKTLLSAKPTFNAGAKFDCTYTHEGSFRGVFHRLKDASADHATLALTRVDQSTLSTTETAGIEVSANTNFVFTPEHSSAALQQAAQAALPSASTATVAMLTTKLKSVADGFIADATGAVNSLLKKRADGKLELQFQQERINADTALFLLDIDFQNPQAREQGLALAFQGNFVDAIAVPGVELQPNSYVEDMFTRRSSIKLNCFDVLKFSTVSEYIEKTDVIYTGHGEFQLRSTVGVTDTTGVVGHDRKAEIYFLATTKLNRDASSLSDLAVLLRLVLTDTGNADAVNETVAALRAIDAQQLGPAAQGALTFIQKNAKGAVKVTCEFPQETFAMIGADQVPPGDDPTHSTHALDRRNYDTFLAALVSVLRAGDFDSHFLPPFALTYTGWMLFNRSKIDDPGFSGNADRTQFGNLTTDRWPEGQPPSDAGQRTLVQNCILAGQHFMNFCYDLKRLASDLSGVETESRYNSLMQTLSEIVKHDAPVAFTKPMLVALFQLTGAVPQKIKIPAATDTKKYDLALTGAAPAAAPLTQKANG